MEGSVPSKEKLSSQVTVSELPPPRLGVTRTLSARGGGGMPRPLQRTKSLRNSPQRTDSLRGNGITRGMQRTKSLRNSPQRTDSLRGNGIIRGAPQQTRSMQLGPSPRGLTRSTSLRSDNNSGTRAGGVQRSGSSRVTRTNSSRTAPRRAPPSRTKSFGHTRLNAQEKMERAKVQRNTSGISETGDLSCYTMDSVNLRKAQLVADPILDDTTYRADEYSVAEHESISRCSMYTEYVPSALDRLKLTSNSRYPPTELDMDQSYASALTNDFENAEYESYEYDDFNNIDEEMQEALIELDPALVEEDEDFTEFEEEQHQSTE